MQFESFHWPSWAMSHYIVVEPRSTRDIEIMLFKLIVKVPVHQMLCYEPLYHALRIW